MYMHAVSTDFVECVCACNKVHIDMHIHKYRERSRDIDSDRYCLGPRRFSKDAPSRVASAVIDAAEPPA